MPLVPSKSSEEAMARNLLGVFTVAPILCFAFQDLGSEYGGMDWLTFGYTAWPLMIAPMAMLALFFANRELVRNPHRGAGFSQTIKIVSVLYLFLNAFNIAYSWVAVISVLASLTILVADWRIKKQAAA